MRRLFPFSFNRLAIVHIATLISLIGSAVYVTPVQASGHPCQHASG